MTSVMTRKEALEKLLQHGPEDLGELTRITGWPEHETQNVLLQLIVAGKVRCVRGHGRERYALRVDQLAASPGVGWLKA